ncbi:hypothetical protein SLS57_002359 [Botryosphaeria dothidea]
MATEGKLDINSKYRLRSGYEIPVLGFGISNVDSARAYRNEKASAAGLLASGAPRSSLFFTSKVAPRNLSYDSARADVDATLAETGLDYIDLYLIHAPYGGREGRLGAWKALVEAVDAGKVRSIGVSNYGVHHLEELETWIKEQDEKEGRGKGGVLSVNQVELHPWCAREDIVQWCRQRGILLEGFVTLPKTVTMSRIEENSKIFDFELDPEDMKSLETGVYEPCTWDPTVSRD